MDTIHWARAIVEIFLLQLQNSRGYFDEVGINVIEDPVESSTAALQALQAKQVDVTSNQGTNNPLQFISTGSDFFNRWWLYAERYVYYWKERYSV